MSEVPLYEQQSPSHGGAAVEAAGGAHHSQLNRTGHIPGRGQIRAGLVPVTYSWEGCRESRRCSRDTYPESYIIMYTRIRRKTLLTGRESWDSVVHPTLSTLEVTQGQILSQSPTDATSSRKHLYGS